MKKNKIIILNNSEFVKKAVFEVLRNRNFDTEILFVSSSSLRGATQSEAKGSDVAIQSGCTEGDFLLVNADEERNFQTTAKILKFGFSELADFKISDANGGENETNFKLNYKGKSVPIWINKKLDLQGVYGILAAFCVGDILGLNVVEMSETLKNI